jgi:hypothetical protein
MFQPSTDQDLGGGLAQAFPIIHGNGGAIPVSTDVFSGVHSAIDVIRIFKELSTISEKYHERLPRMVSYASPILQLPPYALGQFLSHISLKIRVLFVPVKVLRKTKFFCYSSFIKSKFLKLRHHEILSMFTYPPIRVGQTLF